jgi:hypothetical protein
MLVLALPITVALLQPGSSGSLGQDKQVQNQFAFDRDNLNRYVERINVRTANRFHLALVSRMILKMPRKLNLGVGYGGILASDTGRERGPRVHGSYGIPLQWDVANPEAFVVFNLTITPERVPTTVAACKMEKETVFVSVTFIDGTEEVDDKSLRKPRDELGGRSVLEVVKLLEMPAGVLEDSP